MPRAPECPKCSGQMEEGFSLDSTYGANLQSSWIPGIAEKSFWTGMKIKGRPRFAVTTYRCNKCGYLESFAPPQ